MNLDLRQAIIQRVINKTNDELYNVIDSSIGNDERALPGLGVLFEIIWTHCEQSTQQQLVHTLQQNLRSGT